MQDPRESRAGRTGSDVPRGVEMGPDPDFSSAITSEPVRIRHWVRSDLGSERCPSRKKKNFPWAPSSARLGTMTRTPAFKSWPSPASDTERRGDCRREVLGGCPGADPHRKPDKSLGLRGQTPTWFWSRRRGGTASPDRLLGPAEEADTPHPGPCPSPLQSIVSPHMLCKHVLWKMGHVHVDRSVVPPHPRSSHSPVDQLISHQLLLL
uniref:Uncharacterized protein n=1 Tax=Myotis myotis TaxID=51298 RepID=A0A7J7U5P1_MYOMY|nr:hypothetical protein mMyoMyo1_008903 [Myotis myotis]